MASLKHEAFQRRRPCISELGVAIMKARMFETHTFAVISFRGDDVSKIPRGQGGIKCSLLKVLYMQM